jgi:hypothetical protein
MSALDELLDKLETDWDFEAPPARDAVARAEAALGGSLPGELATFYSRADGASIGRVDMFTLDELIDVNRRRTKALKDVVLFASDGGDGFFLIDAGNKMKRGRSAVFWMDRGSTRAKGWVFAALDLPQFLGTAGAGETPWTAPSLGDVDLDAMQAALQAKPERWSGNPPAKGATTYEAGDRLGVLMPQELEVLLETSNGFTVPAAGVTVLGTDELEPVEGSTLPHGVPGAIWFARDDRGHRYAVSVIGWRESDGGDVVRVAPREPATDAPFIGTLPAVVVAWLDGRKP